MSLTPKVRIGLGSIAPGAELAEFVDACEARGIDSIWLADQASGPGIDPDWGLRPGSPRAASSVLGTVVRLSNRTTR